MITALIYQSLISVYKVLPFKRTVCNIIRSTGITSEKFYRDLRFNGDFTISLENGKTLKIISHGGGLENELFWTGLETWEVETFWLWEALCPQSQTIFDVGANIGLYSLTAKKLNPGATVIAFEPSRKTYSYLLEHIAANELDIKAESIALSNVKGELVFYDTTEDHQQSASLNPDKLKNNKDNQTPILEYTVYTNTLDNYLAENGIKQVDLVKIDVEMHEPEVLAGMKDCIDKYHPSMIVEILTPEIAVKVWEQLGNRGYQIFALLDNKKLKPVTEHTLVPYKWNYFFCRPDVAEKMKPYIV